MSLRVDDKLATFLQEVRRAAPDQKVYLVGGAVRDLSLGRAVKDLDFVVADGSVKLAKAVQRRFDGVWYSLDDEHQTARVILKQAQPGELVLDFTAFIGASLEEDLRQRDFTINAMAIDLDHLSEVIDPLGGQEDLRLARLRLSNPNSLLSDPLRVLRAVRMVRAFKLSTSPEMINQLRVATNGINRISGERIRDELLKCLALPNLSLTYDLLDAFGILDQLFFRVHTLDSSGKILTETSRESFHGIDDNMEQMRLPSQLTPEKESKTELNPLQMLDGFLKYLDNINPETLLPKQSTMLFSSPEILHGLKSAFEESLQGGRNRKQLLVLFALFFWRPPLSKPANEEKSGVGCLEFAEKLTNAFMLGQKEQKFFQLVCVGYRNIRTFQQEQEVGPLELYQYFKMVGCFGLESAVLHLVNESSTTTPNEGVKSLAEKIILTWFNDHDTIVDPPRLVDGDDLQSTLHLNPGPHLGSYLESIREAQVKGEIKNRDEALAYVSRLIVEGNYHDR